MAIRGIIEDKCVGCGNCVATCPVDVFRMDTALGKAVVCYPQDCGCCAACLYDCPVQAIDFTPEQNFHSWRSW